MQREEKQIHNLRSEGGGYPWGMLRGREAPPLGFLNSGHVPSLHSFLFSFLLSTDQWCLVYSLMCAHPVIIAVNFRTFPPPQKETPYPLVISPKPKATTNLPLVFIDWSCHINGILQYVAFYVWILSFSIMFSRHVLFFELGAGLPTF